MATRPAYAVSAQFCRQQVNLAADTRDRQAMRQLSCLPSRFWLVTRQLTATEPFHSPSEYAVSPPCLIPDFARGVASDDGKRAKPIASTTGTNASRTPPLSGRVRFHAPGIAHNSQAGGNLPRQAAIADGAINDARRVASSA